jgi:hypothetical protein
MSRSASSCARKSSCATTRLATVSSIRVPTKMIRLRRKHREYIRARSPRLVVSALGVQTRAGASASGAELPRLRNSGPSCMYRMMSARLSMPPSCPF